MLRTLGRTISSVRKMAGEFQSTFNEAIKEAEQQVGIDEMRRQADAAQNFDPLGDLKKSLAEEQSGLQKAMDSSDEVSTSSSQSKDQEKPVSLLKEPAKHDSSKQKPSLDKTDLPSSTALKEGTQKSRGVQD